MKIIRVWKKSSFHLQRWKWSIGITNLLWTYYPPFFSYLVDNLRRCGRVAI